MATFSLYNQNTVPTTGTGNSWQTWWDEFIRRQGVTPPAQFEGSVQNALTPGYGNNQVAPSFVDPFGASQATGMFSFPTINTPDFTQPTYPRRIPTTLIPVATRASGRGNVVGGLKIGTGVSTTTITQPVTPSNFVGDDYEALYAIALARPDIFTTIGKDTTWGQGSASNDAGVNTDWTKADKRFREWYWTTPAMRIRAVEEWIRIGMRNKDPIVFDNGGDPQKIARAVGAASPAQQTSAFKRAVDEIKAIDWLAQTWSNNFNPDSSWLKAVKDTLDPWLSNDEAKSEGRRLQFNYIPDTVENLRMGVLWQLTDGAGSDPVARAKAAGWNGTDKADFTAGGQYGSLYKDDNAEYNASYSSGYTYLPWLTTMLGNGMWKGTQTAYDPARKTLYRDAIQPEVATPTPTVVASGETPITTGIPPKVYNPYTGEGPRDANTPRWNFTTAVADRGFLTGRLHGELARFLSGERGTAGQEGFDAGNQVNEVSVIRDIIESLGAGEADASGNSFGRINLNKAQDIKLRGKYGNYNVRVLGNGKFVIWAVGSGSRRFGAEDWNGDYGF